MDKAGRKESRLVTRRMARRLNEEELERIAGGCLVPPTYLDSGGLDCAYSY